MSPLHLRHIARRTAPAHMSCYFEKMKGSSVEGKGFTESRSEELAKQGAADKRTVELNIDHRNTDFTDCMVINEMTRREIC